MSLGYNHESGHGVTSMPFGVANGVKYENPKKLGCPHCEGCLHGCVGPCNCDVRLLLQQVMLLKSDVALLRQEVAHSMAVVRPYRGMGLPSHKDCRSNC